MDFNYIGTNQRGVNILENSKEYIIEEEEKKSIFEINHEKQLAKANDLNKKTIKCNCGMTKLLYKIRDTYICKYCIEENIIQSYKKQVGKEPTKQQLRQMLANVKSLNIRVSEEK